MFSTDYKIKSPTISDCFIVKPSKVISGLRADTEESLLIIPINYWEMYNCNNLKKVIFIIQS